MTSTLSRADVRPGTIVVVGAEGSLGRRVVARLRDEPDVTVRDRPARLADAAVDLAGADVVVILGGDDAPGVDGAGPPAGDRLDVPALLASAQAVAVPHVVVVSSAMVYGAWPDNPVPLTEDAPLRPDGRVPEVSRHAELERQIDRWVDEGEGVTATVLRPVVTVATEREAWFRRSPWRPAVLRLQAGTEPPRQFVHLDDLAEAVALAAAARLDGAFNVAPDGWLAADTFDELAAPAARVTLPAALAGRARAWWGRAGLGSRVPAELLPYLECPWVVANDRLRQAGWTPEFTNEEAFLTVDRAGALRSMSPRTRQELSLAVVGAGVAALVGASTWALVRRRRRRRQG